MPKISVIVCIHKVAPYLRDCIQSILNQPYEDMEILCIVNDSPDECETIARSYEIDPRLRVIVKNHIGGLGGNRNLGIQESRGQYLLFVDGDDILSSQYLPIFDEVLQQNPGVDIIQTPNIVEFMDVLSPTPSQERMVRIDLASWQRTPLYSTLCLQDFAQKAEYASKSPWGYSTANKLFRKQFLVEQKLEFTPYRLHEDGMFSVSAWMLSQQVIFLSPSHPMYYFYRKRPQSITASRHMGFLDAYTMALDLWKHPSLIRQLEEQATQQTREILYLLSLHWVSSISNHDFRDLGWLLHPLLLAKSIEMERSLFRPLENLSISPVEMPCLYKIFTAFQNDNILSGSYLFRKIRAIKRKTRQKFSQRPLLSISLKQMLSTPLQQ